MTDQRLDPRSPRSVTLLIGDRLPAQCTDVSPGGACVTMGGVFVPGSRLHGSVQVDGESYPFVGEIAWAHPGDLRRRELSRFGVRFLELPWKLHVILQEVSEEPATAFAPSGLKVVRRRSQPSLAS